MTDAEYFAHPYLNNSTLSKLKSREDSGPWLQKYYAFGTLTHAAILQPFRLNLIKNTLDGNSIEQEAITRVLLMKASFFKDPFCKNIHESCSKEVAMLNPNTQFEFNGKRFSIDTKRKYDLFSYSLGYGGDVKATKATTQAEFEKVVDELDYDRGRVFYAKGSGATRDVIIGISKVNYKIFKVLMQVGCRHWKRGEEKLNALAYKYWELNPPF